MRPQSVVFRSGAIYGSLALLRFVLRTSVLVAAVLRLHRVTVAMDLRLVSSESGGGVMYFAS